MPVTIKRPSKGIGIFRKSGNAHLWTIPGEEVSPPSPPLTDGAYYQVVWNSIISAPSDGPGRTVIEELVLTGDTTLEVSAFNGDTSEIVVDINGNPYSGTGSPFTFYLTAGTYTVLVYKTGGSEQGVLVNFSSPTAALSISNVVIGAFLSATATSDMFGGSFPESCITAHFYAPFPGPTQFLNMFTSGGNGYFVGSGFYGPGGVPVEGTEFAAIVQLVNNPAVVTCTSTGGDVSAAIRLRSEFG